MKKNINKIKYGNFGFFIFLLAVIVLLSFSLYSCSPKDEQVPDQEIIDENEIGPDTEEDPDNTDITDETDNNIENIPEENEDIKTPDDPETDGDTEESGITENENPDLIQFHSGYVGGSPGSLDIEANLATGEITGTMILDYKEFSLADGNTTQVCEYFVEGFIKGTIDIETGEIEGGFGGNATAKRGECLSGDVKFLLTGNLTEENKYIVGNFKTQALYDLEFIAKAKN